MKPLATITMANGAKRNIYSKQDVVRSKELSRITSSWNAPIGYKTKLPATKLRQGSHSPSKAKSVKQ